MGSGYSKLKKQAKLAQQQMSEAQDKISKTEVEGISGGGLVSITLNGEKKIKKIKMQKECVDPDDIEGLEDLIVAAHSHALDQLEEKAPSGKNDLFSLFS